MHHSDSFAPLALLKNFLWEIPCVDFLIIFPFIILHVNVLHINRQEALKDAICTYAKKTEEYIFFASSAHYGIIFDIGSKTGFQLSGYVGWKHISLSVNRNLKGHVNEIFYLVFFTREILFLNDVEPLLHFFFLQNLVGKGVNLEDLNKLPFTNGMWIEHSWKSASRPMPPASAYRNLSYQSGYLVPEHSGTGLSLLITAPYWFRHWNFSSFQ